MSIGKEIKRVRMAAFLNQAEFGQAIGGFSFTSINRWENDRGKPGLRALKAIDTFAKENNIEFDIKQAMEEQLQL